MATVEFVVEFIPFSTTTVESMNRDLMQESDRVMGITRVTAVIKITLTLDADTE